MIPKSVPAKYRKHIQFWDDEREQGNGIIVTLKGLTVDQMQPTHTFGEDTISGAIRVIREATRCECEQCQ